MFSKKVIIGVLTFLLFLVLFLGSRFYQIYFRPVVPEGMESYFVEIPTGSELQDVISILTEKRLIRDPKAIRMVAGQFNYSGDAVRPGRFQLGEGWSNLDIVRRLRSGKQAPVNVVLNNERLPEDVAAKVASFIEPDSAALIQAFSDEQLLTKMGYSRETLMSLFIPNTYEFFWNTSPEKFLERMATEHDRFWSKEMRLEKAEAMGMTPAEVYTLASIVEKETNQNSEKRRIAGVYLNRLRIGMRLQADPTCVFATRDFEATRVLNYHKEFDSPYNTYIYAGLPPGPIAMASIASIDAVLNGEQHDYMYFCAVGDGSGLHQFAETLDGHAQNVRRYRANLRKYLNER